MGDVRKLVVFVAALFLVGCRPPYETRIERVCGLSGTAVANEPFIAYGLAGNIGVYGLIRTCRNHAVRLVYSGEKFELPMSFMRSTDDARGKFTTGLISGFFKVNESREIYLDVLAVDPIKEIDIDDRSWDTVKGYNDHQFMRLVIKGEA